MSYLAHSDIAVRMSLNPHGWQWLPRVAYDPPTPIFPKRKTYVFAFLFLQIYLDISDGTMDLTKINLSFTPEEEVVEIDD